MREVDAVSLRIAVAMMVRHNVSAIVLISGEREVIGAIGGIDLEVALVSLASERVDGMHRVAINQFEGGRIAVEHLIGLGHRRIRHVTGLQDAMDAGERERAWRETLTAHGLPVSGPEIGDWSSESGYVAGVALAEEWRRETERFTAVFASNDQMALGVLHAFRDAGIRVPDDVSFASVDDIPEASDFAPPLTTLWQDFDGLGRDIMATVLDVLGDEEHAPDRTTRVPELVVRAGRAAARLTGTPPAARPACSRRARWRPALPCPRAPGAPGLLVGAPPSRARARPAPPHPAGSSFPAYPAVRRAHR